MHDESEEEEEGEEELEFVKAEGGAKGGARVCKHGQGPECAQCTNNSTHRSAHRTPQYEYTHAATVGVKGPGGSGPRQRVAPRHLPSPYRSKGGRLTESLCLSLCVCLCQVSVLAPGDGSAVGGGL